MLEMGAQGTVQHVVSVRNTVLQLAQVYSQDELHGCPSGMLGAQLDTRTYDALRCMVQLCTAKSLWGLIGAAHYCDVPLLLHCCSAIGSQVLEGRSTRPVPDASENLPGVSTLGQERAQSLVPSRAILMYDMALVATDGEAMYTDTLFVDLETESNVMVAYLWLQASQLKIARCPVSNIKSALLSSR